MKRATGQWGESGVKKQTADGEGGGAGNRRSGGGGGGGGEGGGGEVAHVRSCWVRGETHTRDQERRTTRGRGCGRSRTMRARKTWPCSRIRRDELRYKHVWCDKTRRHKTTPPTPPTRVYTRARTHVHSSMRLYTTTMNVAAHACTHAKRARVGTKKREAA